MKSKYPDATIEPKNRGQNSGESLDSCIMLHDCAVLCPVDFSIAVHDSFFLLPAADTLPTIHGRHTSCDVAPRDVE